MKILVDKMPGNISECVFYNTALFEPVLKRCNGDCCNCNIFTEYEQYNMNKNSERPKVGLFDIMCDFLDKDKELRGSKESESKIPSDEAFMRC